MPGKVWFEMSSSTMTPQGTAVSDLLKDFARKVDAKFSEMDKGFQKRFSDLARDTQTMRDDFASVQGKYRERFNALAEHYARGGPYRGPFSDQREAARFGEFVIATASNDRAKIAEIQQASMGPATGVSGGFSLAEEFVNAIIRNVEKYGVIERNTTIRNVGELTGGEPKRTQGFTIGYPDLGVIPTDSDMKFGRVNFNLTRYCIYALADRWMLNSDSAAMLGDFIATEMALGMSYAQDLNGFMGDATPTYAKTLGLFKKANSTQLIVTGDTGDDTFAELITASVKYPTACAGLLPDWVDVDGEAKWFMHRSIFWGFLGVRDTQGRPVGDILMHTGTPQRVLAGYPVEVTQVAPKLADTAVSTTMAILGSLRAATRLFRHKGRTELRVSQDYRFPQGEIAFCLDAMQEISEADDQGYVQLKTHS